MRPFTVKVSYDFLWTLHQTQRLEREMAAPDFVTMTVPLLLFYGPIATCIITGTCSSGSALCPGSQLRCRTRTGRLAGGLRRLGQGVNDAKPRCFRSVRKNPATYDCRTPAYTKTGPFKCSCTTACFVPVQISVVPLPSSPNVDIPNTSFTNTPTALNTQQGRLFIWLFTLCRYSNKSTHYAFRFSAQLAKFLRLLRTKRRTWADADDTHTYTQTHIRQLSTHRADE
uniref:Uncharacterized protein n=1 Tax=Anopheles dirus TaxID=7168 RepID=A0A182NE62_9DIPT